MTGMLEADMAALRRWAQRWAARAQQRPAPLMSTEPESRDAQPSTEKTVTATARNINQAMTYASVIAMGACALLVVISGHFTAKSLDHAAQGPGDPEYDAASHSADQFQVPVGVLWVLAMVLAVALLIRRKHPWRRWNIATLIFGIVGIPALGVAGIILGIFGG
ncbi:MAG: hypothetical protein M3Y19_06255 [Actinomycetota bacterium]|nr:hypothetical protein [Actinomycetota bacterium]